MREFWVYGSSLCGPDWAAWECIGESQENLKDICIKNYGRVPYDCVAKRVSYMDIPDKFKPVLNAKLDKLLVEDERIHGKELFPGGPKGEDW